MIQFLNGDKSFWASVIKKKSLLESCGFLFRGKLRSIIHVEFYNSVIHQQSTKKGPKHLNASLLTIMTSSEKLQF
mgnify:CR=1 FL=1